MKSCLHPYFTISEPVTLDDGQNMGNSKKKNNKISIMGKIQYAPRVLYTPPWKAHGGKHTEIHRVHGVPRSVLFENTQNSLDHRRLAGLLPD